MAASQTTSNPKPDDPADNITAVFTVRRDLLLGIKEVIAGSGLTVEEADLLVYLYGAVELGWDEPAHDREGFVAFRDLERSLVHNSSLLSRRIRKLAASRPPMLEVADADPASGLHFNSKRVRITEEGAARTRVVWERFQRMSAKLLEGIPQRLLDAHYAVNQELSARIRVRRSGLSDLLSTNR